MAKKRTFSRGKNAGNPERVRWTLLSCWGSQSEHEIRSQNQPWLHHSVIQTFKPRLHAEMTSEYFKRGDRIVFFCPGMIDIAVATVGDLYEDNGGIPASLQFPKLDDVKADVNKVSAGGLKPGQAVIINCSILNQASTLPGFAVPDMKKTFGLTGVVKSVDKVTDTYLF